MRSRPVNLTGFSGNASLGDRAARRPFRHRRNRIATLQRQRHGPQALFAHWIGKLLEDSVHPDSLQIGPPDRISGMRRQGLAATTRYQERRDSGARVLEMPRPKSRELPPQVRPQAGRRATSSVECARRSVNRVQGSERGSGLRSTHVTACKALDVNPFGAARTTPPSLLDAVESGSGIHLQTGSAANRTRDALRGLCAL